MATKNLSAYCLHSVFIVQRFRLRDFRHAFCLSFIRVDSRLAAMVKKVTKKVASAAASGTDALFVGMKTVATLMQHREAHLKKGRRTLERKTTAVIVDKRIQDIFMDWSYRVDTFSVALCEHLLGIIGEMAFLKIILDTFPSNENMNEVVVALQSIIEMHKNKVVQCVGATLKAEVESVRGWLVPLRDSRCPSLDDANYEFLLKVIGRFAFFSRTVHDLKQLTCNDAADTMFGTLKDESKKGLDGLVMMGKRLLASEQSEFVDKPANAVCQSVGEKAVAAKGQSKNVPSDLDYDIKVDVYFDGKPPKTVAGKASSSTSKMEPA